MTEWTYYTATEYLARPAIAKVIADEFEDFDGAYSDQCCRLADAVMATAAAGGAVIIGGRALLAAHIFHMMRKATC